MTSSPKAKTCPTPAARQKRVWDKAAPGYDRQIAFFEKTWFTGGREWLGARARGRVLEVAIGTGRSLPHYPAGRSAPRAPPHPEDAAPPPRARHRPQAEPPPARDALRSPAIRRRLIRY